MPRKRYSEEQTVEILREGIHDVVHVAEFLRRNRGGPEDVLPLAGQVWRDGRQ